MLFLRILISMTIGFFLGLSNLYLGLKIGYTVGTALLTVFCWAGLDLLLQKCFRAWPELDSWEYACYQSLSSAMSYGSGTVIATALSAIIMAGGEVPDTWLLVLWVAGVCGLGTCLALPLRARLLEALPFPSGQVAAETVKKLGFRQNLKPFFISLSGVWVWVLLRDWWKVVPARLPLKGELFFAQLSPLLWGLGGLLGTRICTSLFLGGCVFFWLWPLLANRFGGATDQIADQTLWFALGMMVSASLTEFGVALARSRKLERASQAVAEVPRYGWFLAGSLLVTATASIWGFDSSPVTIILLFLLVWVFAMVSARATGETDVTPTGSLGKLSLLIFGFLQPGQMQSNMAATGSLTGNATATTDFMINLKCGAILGCPAPRQFRYQFAGAVLGPVIFVPLFILLISGAEPLGGDVFPAPAAEIWLNVAKLTGSAQEPLAATHQAPLLWGLAVGLVAYLLTRVTRLAALTPTPVPFAMAVVLDWSTVFTLFLGAWLGRLISHEKGFRIWCAMIAAESAAAVALLLIQLG